MQVQSSGVTTTVESNEENPTLSLSIWFGEN